MEWTTPRVLKSIQRFLSAITTKGNEMSQQQIEAAIRNICNIYAAEDKGLVALGAALFDANELLPIEATEDPAEQVLRNLCETYTQSPATFGAAAYEAQAFLSGVAVPLDQVLANPENPRQSHAELLQVNVVGPRGAVISSFATDSPLEAMEEFIATTKIGFGEALGVGSYVALMDPELKLDASFLYEGSNVYRQQFAKDDGLHLHAQLVKAPALTAVDPTYRTMLQVMQEAEVMARRDYMAALARNSKGPDASAMAAALIVVVEDAERRLMRSSAVAQGLTLTAAQDQYRTEFEEKVISFSVDDLGDFLRNKAGRPSIEGNGFSKALEHVAQRVADAVESRIKAENHLLEWMEKDVSELLRGMAPVELKEATAILQAMSPMSPLNPFWEGRKIPESSFQERKIDVATDLAHDLMDELSAAACNRDTYTRQAGKMCHDYLVARAAAPSDVERSAIDGNFTREFRQWKRDRDYLGLPVDRQVRNISIKLDMLGDGPWRAFAEVVDLAERYSAIEGHQDPRFCPTPPQDVDKLLQVVTPDGGSYHHHLLFRDIAVGREYVVPDTPVNWNSAQRAADFLREIKFKKMTDAKHGPSVQQLETSLVELLEKVQSSGLALGPQDCKMAVALEAMRTAKGATAQEKSVAKFRQISQETLGFELPREWDGTVSVHAGDDGVNYQLAIGRLGGQRPQFLQRNLQASDAHGLAIRLSLVHTYANFSSTYERLRAGVSKSTKKEVSAPALDR